MRLELDRPEVPAKITGADEFYSRHHAGSPDPDRHGFLYTLLIQAIDDDLEHGTDTGRDLAVGDLFPERWAVLLVRAGGGEPLPV